MNLNDLENKLNNIHTELKDNKLDKIIYNLYHSTDDYNIKNLYYSTLNEPEKSYQKKNDEYKKLISQFSNAYLEICDFYVGPEIPRETYLDSKEDITELFSYRKSRWR